MGDLVKMGLFLNNIHTEKIEKNRENRENGAKSGKNENDARVSSLLFRLWCFVHPRGDAFQNFFETLLEGLGVNANLKLG